MQAQQQAVVDWMREVMARRRPSARAWAEKAGLGKDTVSRALRPDYGHVTTTTTIAKLADAINERPPGLAIVPSQVAHAPVYQVLMPVTLPSETALTQMFEGLLETVDLTAPLDELSRELAQLLPNDLSRLRGRLTETPAHGPVAPAEAPEARPSAAGGPRR